MSRLDAPELDLVIDGLAAGGDAVGRDPSGRVTFVPGAAPGERVRVRLMEEHRSFARAALVEVLARSPDRVAPPCPLFVSASCGGCQWQHVARPVQAAAKQHLVASALRRAVERGLVVHPIESPAPAYGWRRRARLHWFRPPRAAALLGFYAPGSRRITPALRCPQLEPALEAVLPVLQEVLAPALEGRGEVALLAGQGGEVHVAIDGRVAPDAAAALVGRAGIVGVAVGHQRLGASSIALEDGLEGRADAFAQASRAGNAALVARAAAACGELAGRRVLELHAGSGNLTRALAGGGARVVAVEHAPGPPLAVAAGGGEVEWHVGAAERVVEAMARRGERFDLALLDPPRTGARELMAPLAHLAPPAIVYVSCDPATLARDVELLAQAGYAARDAWPLDLMPQTSHVEVVVRLTAAAPGTAGSSPAAP